MLKQKKKVIIGAIAGACLAWIPRVSLGAETVIFSYRPFEFSIAVTDLETFAETGDIEGSLKPFFKSIPIKKRAELKTLVGTQLNINATGIAQLLYTNFGEQILHRMGEIVQNSQHQNGWLSLRAAMIQSAQENQGISPVSMLKFFPMETVYINSTTLNQTLKELKRRSQLNQTLMNALKQDSPSPVHSKPLDPISQSEHPQVQQISLNLPATPTQRTVRGKLLLPNSNQAAPLIIISPGFGNDHTSFKALRVQLLLQGFAVATIDHVGSDQRHFQQILQGRIQEILDSDEWIHRPQDISYLLDWLESDVAPRTLTQKLDLKNIAVLGYSLGGNTVLNLAGGRSNQGQLQGVCQSIHTQTHGLDLAPLMLCPSSDKTPQDIPSLADSRVKAIIAVNAFGSHVFTPQGLEAIQIPSLFITGTRDLVAPPLSESICPFSAMSHPNQSLVIIENGEHYFGNDINEEGLFTFSPKLKQPDPSLMSHYLNTMVLGFVSDHLKSGTSQNNVLTGNQLQQLSQSSNPLYLLNAEVNESQANLLSKICSKDSRATGSRQSPSSVSLTPYN